MNKRQRKQRAKRLAQEQRMIARAAKDMAKRIARMADGIRLIDLWKATFASKRDETA